jgi:RND family efflux transporter MFP subunit
MMKLWRNKHASFIALASVLLLGACSGSNDTATPDPSALVKTATVETGSIDEKITIYGAAENGSVGQYTLSSPIEAIVQSINAPVGSNVSRGQVLVRLLPSPGSKYELATASANTQTASQAYARMQRLRADGLVSDAEVEAARAAKQSADALRASLADRSGSLTLRAPDTGFVQMIGAVPGQLVAAATPVVTIVKDGDIRARFGIDPSLARRVPAGSYVEITAAGSVAPLSVPVQSVDPVVDPQTKLAAVYVLIPNESEIGAGESLTGKILLSSNASGLTIPYAALLDDGGQPYVYVVEKGMARRVDINVGPRMGNKVSVTKGLKANQQVAVDGVTALEDGMKVRTK